MPVGLWGAFKLCDGSCSPEAPLIPPTSATSWRSRTGRAVRISLLSWKIFSQAKNASNCKLVHTGSDGKCAKLAKIRQVTNPNRRGDLDRTGGSENCCWKRLITEGFYRYRSATVPSRASRSRHVEQMLDRQEWKRRLRSVNGSRASTSWQTAASTGGAAH